MKSIAGKIVVITGGASGIGREMALAFARQTASLALLDIDLAALERTREDVRALGAECVSYRCDMASRSDIDETVERIRKDLGPVDILVNNAGIVVGGTVAESGYDDFRKTIDVNLMGVIWITRQFLPEMMQRNSGHIVNVASAAGWLAVPGMAGYCATKFAVVGFSDALRLEMKKGGSRGVNVSCICPSVIDTGMFDGFRPPLLNPLLKPDYVADRILQTIRRKGAYLKIPFMVKLIPLFRMLPAGVFDWLAAATGTTRAMDHFTGHPRERRNTSGKTLAGQ